MVCTVKDKQAQMAYLKDEISDLDKDDPCFDGRGQATLLNDEAICSYSCRRHDR